MEAWWYPALFATGLTAGFVDAIAGGGGLLTVPVLLATGMSPHDALGTNKFQSSCGTTLATVQYAQHGLIPWDALPWGMAATAFGALVGTWTVTQVKPDFLRPILPVLLLAIAVYTATKRDLGAQDRPAGMTGPAFGVVFGLLLGFYDGFFGPGTGSFWTMACVIVLGMGLLPATAYTKAMNLTSNLVSLGVLLYAGHVRFDAGLVMAAGQVIGGRLGAKTAVKGGARVIRPVFLTMVCALTVKLGWDAWRSH